MPVRYAGGDPDELLFLARILGEAAADLQRLQVRLQWAAGGARLPPEPAVIAARARVWTAAQSEDVRRRARELADDRRFDIDVPGGFPPLAGQHGGNRLGLTEAEAQLARARATLADPSATKAAKGAAKRLVETQRKKTGDKRSRPGRDAKPAPKSATALKEARARKAARQEAKKAAEEAARETTEFAGADHELTAGAAAAGAAAAVATGVWWAGKLLSPACGPAAPLCAIVL